jgi:hypothetical protein
MDEQSIDVFFYGLFMDDQLLAGQGIAPRNPRRAVAESFALRIGQRATLVPAAGARAYGMVYTLTRPEVDRLYAQPGLDAYRAESIAVRGDDGSSLTVKCYNLAAAPDPGEANADYAARLREVLTRLGFPQEYVTGISTLTAD